MLLKRLTIWDQIRICLGAVLVLTCALSIVSMTMIGGLGQKLDTAVNQNARAAFLLGRTEADLQQMRHLSADTQYAYVLGSLLSLKTGKTNLGTVSADCSACHSLGTVEDRQRTFDQVAARAMSQLDQLQRLLASPESHRAA
ncbi:MAG: hypothetical protein NTY38_05300, partial [Acidobacteria bacterium]|nr:hypothetical protein [Acidobacteriota bacterium]